MDDREKWLSGRKLPEATDAFADAILTGGERIRRYERRRRRIVAVSALAATVAVAALAASLFFGAFRPPQPDNVVVAAPSQSAAPSATPGTDVTPQPEQYDAARTEPEALDFSGLEPYSWLKVIDEDGEAHTNWEAVFYQQPRPDSRCISVIQGTLVHFLEMADDGFVKVRFAGADGYMESRSLGKPGPGVPMYVVGVDRLALSEQPGGEAFAVLPRHARVECLDVNDVDDARWALVRCGSFTGWVDDRYLGFFWESEDWKLYTAQLTVNDATGEIRIETLNERESLGKLEAMLREARPGILGQCAQGALLTLTLRDDSELTFTMPTDGCVTLLCDNLAVYELPDADAFWSLFPATATEVLGLEPGETAVFDGEGKAEESGASAEQPES